MVDHQVRWLGGPSLLVRHRSRWFLWRGDEQMACEVDLDTVVAAVRASGASPAGSDGHVRDLPTDWIATISGGAARITSEGRVWVIAPEDLRSIPSGSPGPDEGTGVDLEDLLLPAPRAPMIDPVESETLLNEGWIVRRLLDDGQVAAMRAIYGRLHGWEGEGFEPDPGNPDADYRSRVADAIDEVIREPFAAAFRDMRPLLRSFYCKWPNTPELDLHWDWSCVDEQAGHRAYQVWIALQDTHASNGQMLVLPRSHRIDERPRSTGLAIPLSEELVALEQDARSALIPVPLRAGEALIFDLGLVHISDPNDSLDPRLAAVILLRPSEAPLAYYRPIAEDVAVRFAADEDWYNTMVPAQLYDGRPALEPTDLVEMGDAATVRRRVERLLAGVAGR